MKSGLEDRNNEQMDLFQIGAVSGVSMKSGLEDRNNERQAQLYANAVVKASQ